MADLVVQEKVKEEKRYVKAKVMVCTCKHEYQDKLYGRGMRVHNPMAVGRFRCTVCGTEK